MTSPTQTQTSHQQKSNYVTPPKRQKRPRRSPLLNTNSNKVTKLDYWLNPTAVNLTPNSNKFSLLSDNDTANEEDNTQTQSTEPKPPPLFVAGVVDIKPLTKVLEEVAERNFFLKVLNHDEIKIQAKSVENYDRIVEALKSRNTEFHSYQKKEDRPFKVVLRNIHCSTDLNILKQEIEALGHSVVKISNIRHRISKNPLPLFFVDLKIQSNNKEIYSVEFLVNTKIKFEPPHKKREIPQCTRCQRYGHTKNFCSRQARCVKCALDHQTSACPNKERSSNPKCVLCNGNHPANYKGCSVFKDIQKAKFPPLREKATSTDWQNQASANPQVPHTVPSTSYADAVRNGNQPQVTQPTSSNDFEELKSMLKSLMEQMSTMLNLLTAIVSKTNHV